MYLLIAAIFKKKLCYYINYVNLMITVKSSSDNYIHFLINCTIILWQESKNALLDHIGT